MYAGRLYEGRPMLERAGLDSDMSVREMVKYLKARKISSQYGLEDLEEDMKNFYRRMARIFWCVWLVVVKSLRMGGI